MKKIQCISVDIDGTFIKENCYSNDSITKENIEAIKSFCQAGGKIIFSSGRDPKKVIDLFEYLKKYGLTSQNIPYLVCLNGSVILDTNNSFKAISRSFFDPELCKNIVNFLDEKEVTFFLIDSKNFIHFTESFFSWCLYILLFRNRFKRVDFSPQKPTLENIQKIVVFLKLPFVRSFKKKIIKNFGDKCYCSTGPKFYLEVVDSKIDKYYGLQQVSDLLKVPIENFAAIGNEQNDIKSLENVGYGIGINLNKISGHISFDPQKIKFTIDNNDGTAVHIAIKHLKEQNLF